MNRPNDWWYARKEELLALAGKGTPLYVYNEETLNETLFDLLSIDVLDVLFYPVHANPHPKILRKAFELDVGFKCISLDEMTSVLESFPKLAPQRILFVPDHAHGEDLEPAFHHSAHVVVTDLHTLKMWPGIFQNREIFICLDTGNKQGGSGLLVEASSHFPENSTLILGNDTRVIVNYKKEIIDIPAMGDHLEAIKDAFPQFELCLEMPVYMVSHAGVLLAKVTNTCEEEGIRYIRINLDMEAPMYDELHVACHQIVNLSNLYEETTIMTRISGQDKYPGNAIDFMKAPASVEKDDILLFTNMGTYEPGRELDDKGRDSVPEHYLSARSMCQVKI